MNRLQRFVSRLFGLSPARRSAFAGAATTRLTGDFVAQYLGPHLELRYELAELRARARDLERNNCYARRYLGLLAEHVVGSRGIRLQSLALKTDGTPDLAARRLIEQKWEEWGQACDVSGRLSWVEFQQLGIRGCGRDGEGFVRLVEGFDNPSGFALQLLDPDLFDEGYNDPPRANRRSQIVMAIEVDAYDRPIRFHPWTDSPHETLRRRERGVLSAAEVVHLTRPRRAGQIRSESWLAPAMIPLRMLAGYSEAELVAARTSAAKMGFIVRKDPLGDGTTTDGGRPQTMQADPGVLERLEVGEEFQQFDPTHPGGTFDPFTRAILREVAAGLSVAYSSLSGDLSQANYGSQRGGLLQERDTWRTLQTWYAGRLHRRVFQAWLRLALTTGFVNLPYRDRARLEAHRWQPRGWDWIDPYKDIKADTLAINYGLTSRTKILAAQGEDFADLVEEIKLEQAALKAAGLTFAEPAESRDPNASAPVGGPLPTEEELVA